MVDGVLDFETGFTLLDLDHYRFDSTQYKGILRYRKMMSRAKEIKQHILEDEEMYKIPAVNKRARYIESTPDFKELLAIGKCLKKYENKHNQNFNNYILFSSVGVLFCSLLSVFITALALIFIIGLVILRFNPQVRYKNFIYTIYIPLLLVANDLPISTKVGIEQNKKNKLQSEKDAINKKTFKLNIGTINADVQKQLIIMDTTNYKFDENNKLIIYNKPTTIFCGYRYTIPINSRNSNLVLAVVNDNVFYKTSALTEAEFQSVEKIRTKYPALSDLSFYKNKEIQCSSVILKKIEKNILKMRNEIGDFCLLLYEDRIVLMVKSFANSEDIKIGNLQPNLDLEEQIDADDYIVASRCLFTVIMLNKLKKHLSRFNIKPITSNKIKSKKTASVYFDMIIGMLISVVLSAVVVVFATNVVFPNYIEKVNEMSEISNNSQTSDDGVLYNKYLFNNNIKYNS